MKNRSLTTRYSLLITLLVVLFDVQTHAHHIVPVVSMPVPVGAVSNPMGWLDGANCDGLNGWAFDRDNLGQAVTVDIYVDGVKTYTGIVANGDRPDLVGAFGDQAARYHGYNFSFPVNAAWRNGQTHTITARIAGANTDLSGVRTVSGCTGGSTVTPPTVTPPVVTNADYRGNLEYANCSNAGGWVFDKNHAQQPGTVDMYVNGVKVGTAQATISRPDVTAAYGLSGYNTYGFGWTVPDQYKNGSALNISARFPGTNTDINSSPVTTPACPGTGPVTPPTVTPPVVTNADYQGYLDGANCDGINGWVFDRNHTQQSAYVDVYVNGQKAATVLANNSRPDVAQAYGIAGYSQYGYNWTLPDSYKNGSALNISVKYIGSNTDVTQSPGTTGVCAGVPPIIIAPTGVRPLNPGDPNLTPSWDWTTPTYSDVFYDSGVTSNPIAAANGNGLVTSPFWDGTQVYVGFRDQADMYPQDGWMLVARDFGTRASAQPYPFFALYNKYKGVLRVAFFQSAEKNLSSYHMVSLSFQQNPTNPKLPLPSFTFADPNPEKGFINQADNTYVQKIIAKAGRSEWMVADFNVSGYSSGTFDSAAAFVINIKDIDEATLSLAGDITLGGTAQPASNGPVRDNISTVSSLASKTLETIDKVTKGLAKGAEVGINPAAFAGGVLSVIDAGLAIYSALNGDPGGYSVNLKGTVSLSGSLTYVRDAGSIAIYLNKQSDNGSYNPIQTIPWGIIGIVGVGPQGYSTISSYIYKVIWHTSSTRGKTYFEAPTPIFDIQTNVSSGLALTGMRVGFPDITTAIDSAVRTYNLVQTNPPKQRVNTRFLKNVDPVNTVYYTSFHGDASEKNFLASFPVTTVAVAFIFKPISPTRRPNDSTVIYRTFNIPVLYEDRPRTNAIDPLPAIESVALPYPNPFSREVNIPIHKLSPGANYIVRIQSSNGITLWTSSNSTDATEAIVNWRGETNSGQRALPGMYICQVIQGDRIIASHKIILEP